MSFKFRQPLLPFHWVLVWNFLEFCGTLSFYKNLKKQACFNVLTARPCNCIVYKIRMRKPCVIMLDRPHFVLWIYKSMSILENEDAFSELTYHPSWWVIWARRSTWSVCGSSNRRRHSFCCPAALSHHILIHRPFQDHGIHPGIH